MDSTKIIKTLLGLLNYAAFGDESDVTDVYAASIFRMAA
jgi:hypothetical protein